MYFGRVNKFGCIDEIFSYRHSLQQGKTTPERFETETTVNTRTTDRRQRNHASHASTLATRSNTGGSFSDSSLSKKNVATESLVSTLDNVTFSVKNFEYRVHEHFLCWRQIHNDSAIHSRTNSCPENFFSCSEFDSTKLCQVAPALRFSLSVLPAPTLLILVVHSSAVPAIRSNTRD